MTRDVARKEVLESLDRVQDDLESLYHAIEPSMMDTEVRLIDRVMVELKCIRELVEEW